MPNRSYIVVRNDTFYAIKDQETDDLVANGNLWDRAYEEIEERGISEEQFILELHQDAIKTYEQAGLTIWDIFNLAHGHKISAPDWRKKLLGSHIDKNNIQD